MKRFFYLCAALLCLSLAFHFGYTTARAQAPGNPLVAIIPENSAYYLSVTANGDIYESSSGGISATWLHRGNVFGGGPVPALHESWGQLKDRYRTAPPATPGMTAKPGASDR